MFLHVLSIENTKISRRKMFWVLLILIALLVLIIEIVLFSTYRQGMAGIAIPEEERLSIKEAITWPGALVNILTTIGGSAFGGLFFVILIGAMTAQEYSWRTLHQCLSRGVPRPLLLVAKFTALLFPAIVFVITALLIGGSITALTSTQINDSLQFDQVNILQLMLSILRTSSTLLPYGALTFFMAVVSRSTVVAVGGGLSFVLLLENLLLQLMGLVGGVMREMIRFLPNRLAESLLSANQLMVKSGDVPSSGSIDAWAAALGILLWTLLFLGLSLWVFQKQDLSE